MQKGSPSRVSLTKRSGWSERAARTSGEPRPDADSENAPLGESRQRQVANSLDWQAARNAETDKPVQRTASTKCGHMTRHPITESAHIRRAAHQCPNRRLSPAGRLPALPPGKRRRLAQNKTPRLTRLPRTRPR
jgi:hypothetical protein